MADRIPLALVGIGKIARDQHIPSIAGGDDFVVAAGVSRHGKVEGAENFTDFDAFLAARPDIKVVSLCTPPEVRFDMAKAAIASGRHVLMEKPPATTLGEAEALTELAAKAGSDPVEFRLAHLADPRAKAVIKQARDAFGWPTKTNRPGAGVGFAFARYKNIMGYCAIAVELTVHPQTGEIEIDRVVTAVDVGQIVSPDGLRNQVQGGIIQSASWTLYEAVDYDANGVRSYDWSGYPILRFPQLPSKVEVHLIDQPGQPFLGAAEIVQGPMAGAIGNALANATGQRRLMLPLTRSPSMPHG